ncbi:MAG: hypothetical protein BGO25_05385 [Acidobacteriales bacterium 59-55]|nr:hypothetical protein [Terriglobales bacterium]OJV44519.1 MAG: hypothetical protein BGO25_05385 [Acidobacteriales bacterium 59-55]
MKITIDNLDGRGAVDYSGALCAGTSLNGDSLKIERVLNAPSRSSGMLDLSGSTLAAPVRRARVVMTSDGGTVLFTGYLATEPERVYAGVASTGPVYRYAFSAVSDEWLLDKQAFVTGGSSLAQGAGLALTTLTERAGSGLFTTTGVAEGRAVGVFAPMQTENWSTNAGRIADAAYAAYRVLDGAVSMQSTGAVTHVLSDGDGTLQIAALKTAAVRELANDVTLSGEIEPAAYIAESFAGDGATAVFQLSEAPFRPKGSAAPLIDDNFADSFDGGVFNPRLWQLSDPGSHLGFGAAGLAMTGGNGFDGQTTLTAIDPVEIGGTLVIEAGSVQLGAGSAGIVCGLYHGATESANCFAGYNVRQAGGATVVVPLVEGVEAGTAFTLVNGHTYTLRIRIHSVESQRVLQAFYTMVDGAIQSFGEGAVEAPASLVFELQDLGAASNAPATVLYDSASAGVVASSPASCAFVAVNSVQLFGSMGYCRVTQTGSAWVASTLADGTKLTRLAGIAGEGVDCTLSATGKVTFFNGRIPVAGEIVTVTYRGRRRAVARLEDAASVAAEAAGGMPGTAQWLGRIVSPRSRSSVDCENAALAVLSSSASRAAAIAGSYEAVNPADIWPGDVLAISRGSETLSVVVRRVEIVAAPACPELLTYRIAFANDWAASLGLKLSEAIATDALLPQTALTSPSNVLANLQQLQIVSTTGSALQVDAGTAPPTGGGFEVRRRDWSFGPGVDQDLVLRSPVRNFSIPREAQAERYFVRMYDGSTPPVYSRFSSAIFTNLPVG